MGRILTATEHVYSVIKQLILSGELAPGEKIDQDALADRIGVSKARAAQLIKTAKGTGGRQRGTSAGDAE